ncbi:hypothetical protein EI94DRAFT_1708430 [Lactarius quietus]|nr:hypothetical protein EI94DRAFT_1708430 [Lactarius quietus]
MSHGEKTGRGRAMWVLTVQFRSMPLVGHQNSSKLSASPLTTSLLRPPFSAYHIALPLPVFSPWLMKKRYASHTSHPPSTIAGPDAPAREGPLRPVAGPPRSGPSTAFNGNPQVAAIVCLVPMVDPNPDADSGAVHTSSRLLLALLVSRLSPPPLNIDYASCLTFSELLAPRADLGPKNYGQLSSQLFHLQLTFFFSASSPSQLSSITTATQQRTYCGPIGLIDSVSRNYYHYLPSHLCHRTISMIFGGHSNLIMRWNESARATALSHILINVVA